MPRSLSPNDLKHLFSETKQFKFVTILEMAEWNGRQDTNYKTRREALNNAKKENGIARCISPFKTGKERDRNTGQDLRTYTFQTNYGQVIKLREDRATKKKKKKDRATVYPNNPTGTGNQSPHFNAGEAGGKLKHHHNYGDIPKGSLKSSSILIKKIGDP